MVSKNAEEMNLKQTGSQFGIQHLQHDFSGTSDEELSITAVIK